MSRGYAASELGETLAKARTLAEQLRPDSLIRLLNGMHYYYLVRSEHENALRVAQQMEEIVEGQDDLVLSLMAHRQHGASRFYLGEFVVARALFRQCIELSESGHGVSAEDPHAPMLGSLAWTLTYMGFIDQGRSCLSKALSEARQREHAYELVLILNIASRICQLIGMSDESHRYATEGLALSDEHGFLYYSANATVDCGAWLTSVGKVHEG